MLMGSAGENIIKRKMKKSAVNYDEINIIEKKLNVYLLFSMKSY